MCATHLISQGNHLDMVQVPTHKQSGETTPHYLLQDELLGEFSNRLLTV